MDALLSEYQALYVVRAARYQHDPDFAQSFTSETALANCIAECSTMEELMGEKAPQFRQLAIANGVALVKDQALFRKKIYHEAGYELRAGVQQQILDAIDASDNDMAIVQTVNDINTRNAAAILVDEAWPAFFVSLLVFLQNAEAFGSVALADNGFQSFLKEQVVANQDMLKQQLQEFTREMREHAAAWQPNFELLRQQPHRQKIPVSDAELDRRIHEISALYAIVST